MAEYSLYLSGVNEELRPLVKAFMPEINEEVIIFEQQLVAGCLEGKEKYFKMLYEKYFHKMINICRRYTKDVEEARDVVQEGYVEVFKKIGQFKFEGSLEGWIRRIMVYKAIDQFRKNKMNNITDYIEDDIRAIDLNSTGFEMNNACSHLDAKSIMAMVEQLTPSYRSVFNLYAIEGFSHKEIAEMLGITESTSRSNLLKARLKLQALLPESNPIN